MTSLSALSRIHVTVTGARGGLGIIMDAPPVPGQVLVKAPGAGNRRYVTTIGATPANAVPQTSLASDIGASLVGYKQLGSGAVSRPLSDKVRERVSVKDFGAVGDGTTNDRAAMVAAYNYCVANGKTLYFPAGIYRGWLLIEASNVAIEGDGSAVTIIKLPDGAQHTIPNNNAGSGPMATGTPCVIDFGNIGTGNDATVRQNAHISGLTLDGNKANTTAPTLDLFGWGLAFTKYSAATYDDIVAVNCHAGGIGTFINSNYHRGTNWQASRCGFNLGHPGFDVNSSKYSVWSGVVDSCREGARMLDNCRNNSLDVSVASCDRTGFIYGNQLSSTPGGGNFSENNDIVVRVDGGCSVAGVQVGAKCASGTITATLANIQGVGVHEIVQGQAGDSSRGIHYTVSSIRGARGSCIVGGMAGHWVVTSTDDGQSVPAGSQWAIDVFGDNNILAVAYQDTATKLRGIQFNASADNNRLAAYTYTNTVQALADSGTRNVYRGFKAWQALTLISGYNNAFGDGPTASHRLADDGDILGMGVVNGTTPGVFATLPAGRRPEIRLYFGSGSGIYTVDPNGQVAGSGAGPWNLAAMRFQPV